MKKIIFIIGLLLSAPLFGAAHIEPFEDSINDESLWFDAIKFNNIELARTLLTNKTDINIKNSEGNTALHLAVIHKHKDLVELLINNKVDIYLLNSEGKNALDLAKKSDNIEIIEILSAKHETSKDEAQKEAVLKALNNLGKKRKTQDVDLHPSENGTAGIKEIEKEE